jgi:serpin B
MPRPLPALRAPARLIAAAGAALLLATACTDGPLQPPDELTALPRALTPAEIRVEGSANAFTFALLGRLAQAQPGKNVFVSPLSASMALGMTMNGADGATLDQMRSALRVGDASQDDVNRGHRGLVDLLRGLDPSVEFRIANGIWHQRDWPFESAFLAAGRQWFDAEIQPVDFANPATSRTINDWVSAQTKGRIPRIVDDDLRDHVMLLVNAIYFKGAWRARFDPSQTRDAPFRLDDGRTRTVRMMHRDGKFLLARMPDGSEGATLVYGAGAFAMTVLLPPPVMTSSAYPPPYQPLDAFAAGLTAERWTAWQRAMREVSMDLYLPRFRLEWERTLNDDLRALGMVDAFDPSRASFRRMSSRDVYVQYVKQRTFVDVNEEGTEAAAATAVGIGPTSAPPAFRVDRPFVFLIHERLSGTVLFVGKVAEL